MEATQYHATYAHRTHSWSEYLSHRASDWLRLALLFAASIIILAPVVWTLSTSLRTPAESFSVPPQWIPLRPDFRNYIDVFLRVPFGTYVVNSFIVTGAIVLGQLLTASLAGYAFARLNFPFRDALFWLVMATVMVPLQATIIPVFVLISTLGLADTLASLILPALPTAFGTFLLRQYFMSMPNDYEEAALIDGCGRLGVLFRIVLPLSGPAVVVVALFSFTQAWNEFLYALVFTNSLASRTLTVGLTQMLGEDVFYWGQMMAGALITAIPPVIMYTLAQRLVIKGLVVGGVKG